MVLTFTLYVPLDRVVGTHAYAVVGDCQLGVAPDLLSAVRVVGDGAGLTATWSGTVGSGTVLQTITFDPLADAVITSGTRSVTATSDSGLPVAITSRTPGTCTVAGGIVTLVATGTCTLDADQPGNAEDAPATTVSRSFAITRAPQVIAFPQPPDTLLTAGTRTLTATSDAGLPITFTSDTPGVCTIGDSTGSSATVTLVAAGTCTVAAGQAGTTHYAPATTVTRSFTVTRAGQTIAFHQPTDTLLGAGTRAASASADSGLPVTISSATTGVCTVTATDTTGATTTATVTLLAPGTCTLDADQPGDATHAPAATVTRSFLVALGPARTAQTITFGQPSEVLLGAGTRSVTARSDSGLTVTVSSRTPAVCTVAGSDVQAGTTTATVALLATGTCTLDADQPGDAGYTAATTVTRSFTVAADPVAQTITFAALGDLQLIAGTRSVTAVSDSGLAVTITSATPDACTVSGGIVTLLATGTCTLDADQPGDPGHAAAVTVRRSFTITRAGQTLAFPQPSDTLIGAGTRTVAASSDSGLTVAVSTRTPAVCTVTGTSGATTTVSLVSAGTCTLDADQPGDAAYAPAATLTRSFAVTLADQTIAFRQPSDAVITDGSRPVTAISSAGLPVTLAVTTPAVCAVAAAVSSGGSTTATVTLLATGTCTIDADQPGSTLYAAAPTSTRSFSVVRADQAITFPQPDDLSLTAGTQTVSAVADSGLPVTFTSRTPGVCTVSGALGSAATIPLLITGTCMIAADQSGNATYAPAPTVTRSFTVTDPVPPPVAPAIRMVGAGLQVQTAVVDVPDDGSAVLIDLAGVARTAVALAGQGTFLLDPVTGLLTFRPAPRFVGTTSALAYRVTDAYARNATGALTATVVPLSAPALSAGGVQGDLLRVTARPHEPSDGLDPATVRLLSGDTETLSLAVPGVGLYRVDPADGSIGLTPTGSFTGSHQVTYRAYDIHGEPAQSTLTVTLRPLTVVAGPATVETGTTARATLSGLPDDAVVRLGTAAGIRSARYADGRVEVGALPGFSGRVVVPVTVVHGSATVTGQVVVTFLPARVRAASFRPVDGGGTTIGWQRPAVWPGTVFQAVLSGRVLCRADGSSCTVPAVLGPRSAVQVVTVDRNRLTSTPVRADYRPGACTHIATVTFPSGSATLGPDLRTRLNQVAGTITSQGFGSVCVVGFPTGGAANRNLVRHRVQAVADLLDLRTGKARITTGYDRTPPGPAAVFLRRVEIGVR